MEALGEIDKKIEKERDENYGLNLTHNEFLIHDLKPEEEEFRDFNYLNGVKF